MRGPCSHWNSKSYIFADPTPHTPHENIFCMGSRDFLYFLWIPNMLHGRGLPHHWPYGSGQKTSLTIMVGGSRTLKYIQLNMFANSNAFSRWPRLITCHMRSHANTAQKWKTECAARRSESGVTRSTRGVTCHWQSHITGMHPAREQSHAGSMQHSPGLADQDGRWVTQLRVAWYTVWWKHCFSFWHICFDTFVMIQHTFMWSRFLIHMVIRYNKKHWFNIHTCESIFRVYMCWSYKLPVLSVWCSVPLGVYIFMILMRSLYIDI